MFKIKVLITDFDLQYLSENNVHSNATKNRVYVWEEYFRSKIMLKINYTVGHDWSLRFSQTLEDSWMIDIFSKDLDSASKIKSIIKNTLEDTKVEFFMNNKAI